MGDLTSTDRIRARMVQNQLKLVKEHLEAMQRDVHSLEYPIWKIEVDAIWKQIFQQIGMMSPKPQQSSFKLVKEAWTTYLTHYVSKEE